MAVKRPMKCGFCNNGDHTRCPGGVRNGDGSIVPCSCGCTLAGQPRCTDCWHRNPEDIGPDWTCIEKDGCEARLAKRQKSNATLQQIRSIRVEIANRQALEAKVERAIGRKVKVKGACLCCGKATKGGKFLPGHDTKFLGKLAADVLAGELEHEYARAQAFAISPAFGNKFDKRVG